MSIDKLSTIESDLNGIKQQLIHIVGIAIEMGLLNNTSAQTEPHRIVMVHGDDGTITSYEQTSENGYGETSLMVRDLEISELMHFAVLAAISRLTMATELEDIKKRPRLYGLTQPAVANSL